VKIWNVLLFSVAPHSLVDDYQRFGGTCRLHLQGRSDSSWMLLRRVRHKLDQGNRKSPYHGSARQVQSHPEGAEVSSGGKARGLSLSMSCRRTSV
jgi:hypothetical protein